MDGTQYNLLQFHFHSSSEHTAQGRYSPMEVHFVHGTDDGRLAVVGAFMEPGERNGALEPVFADMPPSEGDPQAVAGATVNAADVLPGDRSYYRYDGSLATPPCTEGVKWFVMSNPVMVSNEQIAAYNGLYTGNFRPVQAFNQRSFYLGGVPKALPTTGTLLTVSLLWVAVAGVLVVLVAVWFLRRRQDAQKV